MHDRGEMSAHFRFSPTVPLQPSVSRGMLADNKIVGGLFLTTAPSLL